MSRVDDNVVSFEDLYRTDFSGRLTVTPPLNEDEVVYLHRAVRASGVSRALGPYGFVTASQLLAAVIGNGPSHTRSDPDDGHQPAADQAVIDWSGRCVDWC